MTDEARGGPEPRASSPVGRWTTPGRARGLELVAAAVLVVVSVAVFSSYARAMATTSLWRDEIFSILNYSGKGPIVAATTYDDPNNHVLFNVVASLLPGRGSVDPLRARLPSFVFVAGLLAGSLAFFWRRGHPLVGALVLAQLATGVEALDLFLQARGYGLAALLALGLSICSAKALTAGDRRGLAGLVVFSVLGVWTLPTFALFAAPLLLLVWAVRRDRPSFLAGAAALAGVLSVWLPNLRQVAVQTTGYGARWGYEYGAPSAAAETLRRYFLHPRGLLTDGFAFLSLGLLAVLVFRVRKDPAGYVGSSRLLLSASVAFLSLCLVLRTPIIRSTSFVAVPLAFALAAIGAALLERSPRPRVRVGLALLVLVVAPFWGLGRIRTFEFRPLENWQESAEAIRAIFPPGARVSVRHNPEYLRAYLAPSEARIVPFDPEAFARGQLAVLDCPPRESEPRLPAVLGSAASGAEIRVSQRTWAFQGLYFEPPLDAGVVRASGAGGFDATTLLSDRRLETAPEGSSPRPRLTIELRPGRRYRSLVVFRTEETVDPALEVRVVPEGRPARMEEPGVRHWGRVTLVRLGDRPTRLVELTPTGGRSDLPRISEVWAYALP